MGECRGSAWLITGEVHLDCLVKGVSGRSRHCFSGHYVLVIDFPFCTLASGSESLSPLHIAFNFYKVLLCTAPDPLNTQHTNHFHWVKGSLFSPTFEKALLDKNARQNVQSENDPHIRRVRVSLVCVTASFKVALNVFSIASALTWEMMVSEVWGDFNQIGRLFRYITILPQNYFTSGEFGNGYKLTEFLIGYFFLLIYSYYFRYRLKSYLAFHPLPRYVNLKTNSIGYLKRIFSCQKLI